MQEYYYSPAELAEKLKLHPNTILKALRSGRLKGGKLGRKWLIPGSAIEDFMHSRGQVPVVEASSETVTGVGCAWDQMLPECWEKYKGLFEGFELWPSKPGQAHIGMFCSLEAMHADCPGRSEVRVLPKHRRVIAAL